MDVFSPKVIEGGKGVSSLESNLAGWWRGKSTGSPVRILREARLGGSFVADDS